MAHVKERLDVDLTDPVLVEGLPGVGLVGKIAADHLVEEYDMDLYATVHCDSLAPVAVYHEGSRNVQPPVRLYVAPEKDLLVLQSDVPVNAEAVREFATCLTTYIADEGIFPVYLSGMGTKDRSTPPAIHGAATGDAAERLDGLDVAMPPEGGVISGPTGALVNRAAENDLSSVALVVESDPRFPDPAASRVLIDRAIGPLADLSVSVDDLVERAEDIKDKKEKLAAKMQQVQNEESSEAQPLRMYQ